MIVTLIVLVAVVALGAVMYSQIKPESITLRELGRALMWAGVFALVWWLAQQLPARFR